MSSNCIVFLNPVFYHCYWLYFIFCFFYYFSPFLFLVFCHCWAQGPSPNCSPIITHFAGLAQNNPHFGPTKSTNSGPRNGPVQAQACQTREHQPARPHAPGLARTGHFPTNRPIGLSLCFSIAKQIGLPRSTSLHGPCTPKSRPGQSTQGTLPRVPAPACSSRDQAAFPILSCEPARGEL